MKISLVWVISCLLFQLLFPISGIEPRYLLPITPAIIVLFSGGVSLSQEWFRRWSWPVRYGISAVILLSVFLPQPLDVIKPVNGYGAVVETISYQRDTVVLVSSGSMGEGALVVKQRLRDPQRQTFVLRASKVLGVSTWMGRCYTLCFRTAQEIQEYLNRVPVHFIVLDDYGYTIEAKDLHHELLRQALDSWPDNFVRLGQFPITRAGRYFDSGVVLYENRRARGRVPGEIRLDLSKILGRELKTTIPRPLERE